MWRQRKQAGFTLVEVMITVAILSIGILGASGMVASTIRGNKMARNITVANQLAEMEMQRWMELGHIFSQRGALYSAYLPPAGMSYPYGSMPGYPAYRLTVSPVYGSPVGYSITVTVQVFWMDKGKEHSVRMGGHTYVTADGVSN